MCGSAVKRPFHAAAVNDFHAALTRDGGKAPAASSPVPATAFRFSTFSINCATGLSVNCLPGLRDGFPGSSRWLSLLHAPAPCGCRDGLVAFGNREASSSRHFASLRGNNAGARHYRHRLFAAGVGPHTNIVSCDKFFSPALSLFTESRQIIHQLPHAFAGRGR